jgi:heptaprenyl diphosphate synthase
MLMIPIPIPGGKLGLANIATLIALDIFGLPTLMLISVVRASLGAFLSGGLMAVFYSLSGAILSTLVMWPVHRSGVIKRKTITKFGVGVLGAVAHNIGQILVAILLLKSVAILSYLPILLITSAFSGAITGWVSMKIKINT